jgi:hypothetical protein
MSAVNAALRGHSVEVLQGSAAARVAFEHVCAVAPIGVPDADAAVGAAAGQQPAGAVHRQIRYRRAMTLHCQKCRL